MANVLLVQSHRKEVAGWVKECMSSVSSWAGLHGYDYEFMNDALFEWVAPRLREKYRGREAMIADLARLLWIDERLRSGRVHQVVWLDADVLILDARWQLTISQEARFGVERWLQEDKSGRPRVYQNVHNGFLSFGRGCPVLAFLIQTTRRLLERADVSRIPLQFVGPKLLTSLHSIYGFDLEPKVGAISPLAAQAVVAGDQDLLTKIHFQQLGAANLCGSLAEEIPHAALVKALKPST